MNEPNIFKIKMAMMGASAKDVITLLKRRGVLVNQPELSCAIHGGVQPKHRLIRDQLIAIFDEWEHDMAASE